MTGERVEKSATSGIEKTQRRVKRPHKNRGTIFCWLQRRDRVSQEVGAQLSLSQVVRSNVTIHRARNDFGGTNIYRCDTIARFVKDLDWRSGMSSGTGP
jgi:hypothetical protein